MASPGFPHALSDVRESSSFSFPQEEEAILAFWDATQAFEEQLRLTEGKPEYSFYDGPPFATGLPHYGHILAGTIKARRSPAGANRDIVTRYASSTGHHVTRRFGWDCHGLPVEYEIDKKLDIKSRADVLALGIDKYNEECRSIVMRYSKEWETIVHRLGRWIDFRNDYKTLDPGFMESVWWVFKQLFDKGLVYRGFKVMPYSTGCSTPLSNFEAGQNYKDVSDPAVVVAFPLDDDPDGAAMVAWTTTPWTLPSNLALCVNPEFTYVKARDPATGKVYIVAESRLAEIPGAVPKAKKGGKGKEAAPKGFEAPAFGEDDYRVCLAHGVVSRGEGLPCPVDDAGCFTDPVEDFKGQHVKAADKEIIRRIKDMGRLVDHGAIVHSYPFCWRSDTPLIYKAVPSWFVRVEDIKTRLLANNAATHWVPSYVKDKRFHNWLENARDWAISRSRFWGTPIPIWVSEDMEEVVAVGSVAELEALTGERVTDLHRHFIDHLTIPSRQGKGVLQRVEDVFDCWFESGSMPYAQQHYPFENKEKFEKGFPADFVAEGLDQTRGWFYTLMVLSTALFDKPAFKNLVCNGLVLAADGKKMSKRLKNYPDPLEVVHKYGADALRLYLINSPVVRAETLKFREEGVFQVVKEVFLPWYNAYRFLVQNVRRWEAELGRAFDPSALDLAAATNVLDRWIGAASRSLVTFVREEMEAYRLYTVVPYLVKFVDSLTNIYVRYNRKRLKGRGSEEDCAMALTALYDVLLTVMSPFTPFFTESLYQNLRRCLPAGAAPASVHYCEMPPAAAAHPGDEQIERSVDRMQRVIELSRNIRERHGRSVKVPVRELIVVHPDADFLADIAGKWTISLWFGLTTLLKLGSTSPLAEYVREEVNCRELSTCADPARYATVRAEPEWGVLGKRLGQAMGLVAKGVKELTMEQILAYEGGATLVVEGVELGPGDIKVRRDFQPPEGSKLDELDAGGDGEVLVVMDLAGGADLAAAGTAREVVNRVQRLRKKAGLSPTDAVEAYVRPAAGAAASAQAAAAADALLALLAEQAGYVAEALGLPLLPASQLGGAAQVIASEEHALPVGEDGQRAEFELVLVQPAAGGSGGDGADGVQRAAAALAQQAL
eukprot:scaffold1.g5236.t1